MAYDLTIDPLPNILLAGTINSLAGSPNAGKTTIAAWMATRFRDGLSIFGHQPPHPYWIGYISADRPWFSGERTFTKIGFPDIPQFSFSDDTSITKYHMRDKHKRVEILVSVIEKLKAPDGGIVIVDPLAKFLGNNMNDADMVGECCRELHHYLTYHHLTLLGLMHASKQKADSRYIDPFDQMSGSVSFQGHANTLMHLLTPEQSASGVHEFWWRSHHHRQETFQLHRDEATGLFIMDDNQGPTSPRPIPEQCQALYDAFPVHPAWLGIPDVHALFPDTSRPTIFRWLKTLVELHYLIRTDQGIYQKVPDRMPPSRGVGTPS